MNQNIHPQLLGELRELRSDDLELILGWRNDIRVRSNMYTRDEISLPEHVEWWNRLDRDRNVYMLYQFESRKRGVIAFNGIDRCNGVAAWAFYADPEAPRGFGGRMEFLALDHAFLDLGLRKLQCEVLAFNRPVLNLHAKFGFREEGVFRKHHLYEGEFVDVHRLAIFADDWTRQRSSMLSRLASAARAER